MPILDPKVEIEFVRGTWTDVTADVDLTIGVSIRYGRTSEFMAPQTSTCTFQLANHHGKYTPKAQLLADGVTTHPYYPNVVPRKRVRVTNGTIGGRFFGYINSMNPSRENGVRAFVTISASDRQQQFAKIDLQAAVWHEIMLDAPSNLFLFNEPAGSVTCLDSVGTSRPLVVAGRSDSTAGVVTTLASTQFPPLNQPDGLTGLNVAQSAAANGEWAASFQMSGAGSAIGALEAWVTVMNATPPNAQGNYTGAEATIALCDGGFNPITGGGNVYAEFQLQGGAGVNPAVNQTFLTANVNTAGGLTIVTTSNTTHHLALTQTSPGTWNAYVDGVFVGGGAATIGGTNLQLLLVAAFGPTGGQSITWGPIAFYAQPLSATRIWAHYLAGNGVPGELSGTRVARYLTYAGLAASEWNIDAGQALMSSLQVVNGKDVLSLCQDCATTEGGGSAFYVAPDGRARFADRLFRRPGAPVVTFDATKDLEGDVWSPAYDASTLVNTSTVTRAGGAAQTYTDTASADPINGFGPTSDSDPTIYATTDLAALNLAQQRVTSQSQPGIRVPQLKVDLLTAETPGLAAAVGAVQVGSRARVVSLPAGTMARSILDVYVEGWAETITKNSWAIVYDCSAADTPARFVWDDPAYGRWQADPGSITLFGSYSATDTSIQVRIAAGHPAFSIAAGDYPLNIQVGEEILTVTAAPSTSTSPQTLTVTRGTNGSQAARQTTGSVVNLWPLACWTL